MGTTATKLDASKALADSSRARFFHWIVATLVIGGLLRAVPGAMNADVGPFDIGIWALASLLADLMFVRIGKSITLSMSLPVLLAAAYFHSPPVTALIAFLGCLDPRELRGESSIDRILFNRSQVAVAAGGASYAMHLVGPWAMEWPAIVGLSALGLAVDCVVNVALVSTSTVLSGRAGWAATLRGLLGAEPGASLCLYASMCLLAPLLGLIYVAWGSTALLACTAILIPFRLAYARIERLGLTLDVVRLREVALQRAYRSAESERQDERLTLAGDMHDDVLPALFKVHLMGEVLKQDLASGRLLELDEDILELLEATRASQLAVRRFVGGLLMKRSGTRGVLRAIRSCADQQEGDGKPRFDLRLSEFSADEEVELVLVQVAKEAMVNAGKYSAASRVTVELSERPSGWAKLVIADDGSGFEITAVDVESHFGLLLMRDRVEAVGGRLSISSMSGAGTTISAEIPLRSSQHAG